MSPRFFRTVPFAGPVVFAAFAAFMSASSGADLPDSPSPATVKRSLLRKINTFPHAMVQFPDSVTILYQRYPLSGNYPAAAFDTAAKKIEALLSQHGTLHEITIRKLAGCLLDANDSCVPFRYLATPCGISAESREKKAEVGSFVKLNREGDFVPTNATRTINSRTTEVTVRFVMVDLDARTVVFDDWEKATVSDDETIRGISHKGEKPGTPARDQVWTGIMRVTAKVEAKIKTKLWTKF